MWSALAEASAVKNRAKPTTNVAASMSAATPPIF